MRRIVGQTAVCERVCHNKMLESTIEHETHRILHEDFNYDDVADSDVESLINRQ